jgi:hypothetical protein
MEYELEKCDIVSPRSGKGNRKQHSENTKENEIKGLIFSEKI